MKDKNLWKIILYAGVGTAVLFLIVLYGLRIVTPKTSTAVNYAAAAEVGGECYSCHSESTPGITDEYAHSKHVTRGISCLDCHNTNVENAKVTEHQGFKIVTEPTPNNCATCHQAETSQFEASNHSGHAWYAVQGAKAFTQEQLAKYNLLNENGKPINKGLENVVARFEGEQATIMGCQVCHGIGKVREDGSVGDCTKCHLRHKFSLSQARKPETCYRCHLGPDHPQKEIYEGSAHGIMYQDTGDSWNWNAASGTLTVKDMPSATCAICHMSAFGGSPGTHNVGERLSWKLAPEIAVKRDNWRSKRANMISVCVNCHTEDYANEIYKNAGDLVNRTNDNVNKGKNIIDQLESEGVIDTKPFSNSIDFQMFELWHHEGRRARFGGMMDGPDYVQWHGIYEQRKALVEMQQMADELREGRNGISVPEGDPQ